MSMSNHSHQRVPTAADIMRLKLITLAPDLPIFDAIRVLLKNSISGAPVVDTEGKLVGICSELDCLRVLTAGEFYADDHREEGHVADYMSTDFPTVEPHDDIYRLAQFFLTHSVRRLPVMDGGQLVGQLSRRDVLRAMEELGEQRTSRKHYPDYREPSADVGARRSH
jgi:CBS domain-containing protein